MEITTTGTGNAGQIPVWGCHCRACDLARADSYYRRRASTLSIQTPQGYTLIDAGLTDLHERYTYEEIHQIVLTHYHMDHVQGLFHLRWSEREAKIPVYGPADTQGADDLFKHPGLLDFKPPMIVFTPVSFGEFTLTPLPLNHSRPTFGYLISQDGVHIAYLTDTVGLPADTEAFLQQFNLNTLILDCSSPPQPTPPRNHNDLNMALNTISALQPQTTYLTHISHKFQCWLLENKLPEGVKAAYDGMLLTYD